MARDRNDRVVVITGYLAVLAAAAIVASMQVPPRDDTVGSLVSAAQFVIAVAAVMLGFITWFERRFPLDEAVIDLRTDAVELDASRR